MTPESKENAKLRAWLREYGISSIRLALQPGVETGWPDWLILLPNGVGLFIEMKRIGVSGKPTKPTEKQSAKLNLLQSLQHPAIWVTTAHDAIEAIKTILPPKMLEQLHAAAIAERNGK